MANAIRYVALIEHFTSEQAKLAAVTMAHALDYEQYLVNVGKWRGLEALATKFRKKLDAGGGPQDEDFDEPQDTKEDLPVQEPEPAVAPPRAKARSWGGR